MNAPDMRWEADNVKVVGDGTLIWLAQKAFWFSEQDKSNKEWFKAALICASEINRRIQNGSDKDLLLIPLKALNAKKAEKAAKRIRRK